MSLGGVSARFLAGVGAWLLGAAAATGGSLLAVSLLGQGIAPALSQQLTVSAVNHALADEAAEGARSSPASTPSAAPSPRHTKARRRAPAAPAAAAPVPQGTATVLTSVGGTLVARCAPGGAYLGSWSPQQGYEVLSVVRGPAAIVQAKFGDQQRVVVMKVSCTTGMPTVTTSVHRWSDDGSGHDE